MPRYEFTEGTSSKFWEIELSGSSFTTRWGRIGTDGQEGTKSFGSPADARKEYDKLVAEKTKKGYELAGGGGGKAAPATKPPKAEAKPAKAEAKPAAPPAKAAAKAKKPAKADDDDDDDEDEGEDEDDKPAAKKPAGKAASSGASASGTPGARYFEMVEGSSSKFWEVNLDDTTVVTRYGKIGTPGQSTEKEFDSKTAAWKELEKLVAEKTKKGYQEKTPAAVGGATGRDPRNPSLEQAIIADPEDAQAYLVYADWLQQQGDPRGTLITLQHAAEQAPKDKKLATAAAKHLAEHQDYLLGPLAEHTKTHDGRDEDALVWKLGFLHSVKLSVDQDASDGEFEGKILDLLDLVLRHPSGRFLVELKLGIADASYDHDLQALVNALAKKAPPTLRRLHLGDFEFPDQTEMSWYNVGDVSKGWKALGGLHQLIVQGGSFKLGTIELPELRRAEFRTGGMRKEAARAIATATWPKLEYLEVWHGTDHYEGTTKPADVAPLLARTDLPALRHLGLVNSDIIDELCAMLPRSKLLPQLRTLDLSQGTMTDAGAEALAAHKDAFKHLDVLNVSENYLSKQGIAMLKGLAKKVIADEMKDLEEDPDYRSVSVGE